MPYLYNSQNPHIMLNAINAAKLQALKNLIFTFGDNITCTSEFDELTTDEQMLVEQLLEE